MRIKLPFFDRIFVVGWIDLNNLVIGLDSTSFCCKGYQILMLDYDDLDYTSVVADVKKLQNKYGLPSFYLFMSSEGSYHAYCMTCLSFPQAVAITFDSRSDQAHKECLLYNKKSTLRITKKNNNKIEFIEKISPSIKPRFSEIPNSERILRMVIERG